MSVLAIMSFSVMSVYLITMAALYGVREYVSDNYYIGRHPWTFSAVMCTSAMLLLPVMLERGGSFQFLAFFACAGLILVGVEPHYKSEYSGRIHATGAISALVAGMGWSLSMCWPVAVISAAAWGIYCMLFRKRRYYSGEVAALTAVYGTVFF